MEIITPNNELWEPRGLSPARRFPMSLTPHRVMMGASGSGDRTSYAVDGDSDYLSSPDHANWDVAGSDSQDYTIDFFAKFTDHAGTETLLSQREDVNNYWTIRHVHGSGWGFFVVSGGATIVNLAASGGEITDNDWHHVALCKVTSGGPTVEWGIYVDGTQINYLSDVSTDTFTALLNIGREGAAGNYFDGNADEIRITNTNSFGAAPNVGITNTITVSGTPHVSNANTFLLIHCGETIVSGTTGSGATFVDSGATGHTITENGTAIRDTTNYKF